jgi:hypothetical protein
MGITAKVKVSNKAPAYEGVTSLAFQPDYADDRNKEWAAATPTLSLAMTVKDSVAEHFELGQAFTLTFEPES